MADAALRGLVILINNAGTGAACTGKDNSDEQRHRVFDINVPGIVRVARAALPHLRKSQHAAIVNTCSIAATAGLPQRALYSAAKGAVLPLTGRDSTWPKPPGADAPASRIGPEVGPAS